MNPSHRTGFAPFFKRLASGCHFEITIAATRSRALLAAIPANAATISSSDKSTAQARRNSAPATKNDAEGSNTSSALAELYMALRHNWIRYIIAESLSARCRSIHIRGGPG